MTDSVPEEILGYALGALEEHEQTLLEERLEKDASLRERLAAVRRSLVPLAASRHPYRSPVGLAERTCRFVALRAKTTAEHALARPITAQSVAVEQAGRWRWQDATVAAVLLVATAALIFPAIHSSRFQARVAACQDNLRELGMALGHYSQAHRDYFPAVPATGKLAVAGVYAPTLVSDGYLTEARRLVCPASALADSGSFRVRRLEALQSASDNELTEVLPDLGGSYGYSLGHMEEGLYRPTRNLRRGTFAVMADMPSLHRLGHQSDNHGGLGQNVLFEDNHVQFVAGTRLGGEGDDFFVNDRGQVAAGTHRNDSVIAASASGPMAGE
jgi:hypothetical protein